MNEKEVIFEAVMTKVDGGGAVAPLLAAIGVPVVSFYTWVDERPEWRERFARARVVWSRVLVEECITISKDPSLDAKTKRVIIDANLRVAALYNPREFSQVALDRAAMPPEIEEAQSVAELATTLITAIRRTQRIGLLAAPEPEDADFDEAD